MKSTGVSRKLDSLGRIVIPIELRKALGIEAKDALEIYTEGDQIILRKVQTGCVFCGECKKLHPYKGKEICSKCLNDLSK